MSELNEPRWSVLSERGREAARLSYHDAAALVRSLNLERVHGLCIITDEAAERLPSTTHAPDERQPRASKKGAATRRRVPKSAPKTS